MIEETFLIEGMSCASCAKRIENHLKNLPYIADAHVNLVTEKAVISYKKSVKSQAVIAQIHSLGYKSELYQPQLQVSRLEKRRHTIKQMRLHLILSILFTVPVVYLAMGDIFGIALNQYFPDLFSTKSCAILETLFTVVVMFVAYPIYKNGFQALYLKKPNMDSLVSLATSITFLVSVSELFQGQYDHLYFESVAVILSFIVMGKYFEVLSKNKVSESLTQLMTLMPNEAIRIDEGRETTITLDEIEKGDILKIKPGSKIPVDAIIIEGQSAIDESLLTGEGLPVEKFPRQKVYGGTLNGQGSLLIQAEQIGEETLIAQITKLVTSAQLTKSPMVKLVDRISGSFVPFILGVSFLTFLVWCLLNTSIDFALQRALSVLVIACPCALGLATPLAILRGTSLGAQLGILYQKVDVIERMTKVDTVILDKTGTITEGKASVVDIIYLRDDKQSILSQIVSIESFSEHPFSKAIIDYGKSYGVKQLTVEKFSAKLGLGIEAICQGDKFVIGNESFMRERGVSISSVKDIRDTYLKSSYSPIFVSKNQELVAVIAIVDSIKKESKQAVLLLKELGYQILMLTGDTHSVAESVAREVGIEEVTSQVLPTDKYQIVADLQAQGKCVVMVGDGINDSPALALSDIGVAMGSGIDVAIDSSDLVLMRSQLTDLVLAFKLSRSILRVMKENLFWAFLYNIIMIPLAIGVFYGFSDLVLNPMFAALAMSFSSLSVVFNTLRLRKSSL